MGEKTYKATLAENETTLLADILRIMFNDDERTKRATSLKHDRSIPKEEWWRASGKKYKNNK